MYYTCTVYVLIYSICIYIHSIFIIRLMTLALVNYLKEYLVMFSNVVITINKWAWHYYRLFCYG